MYTLRGFEPVGGCEATQRLSGPGRQGARHSDFIRVALERLNGGLGGKSDAMLDFHKQEYNDDQKS